MKKITSFLMVLCVALGAMAQSTETYDFYNFATGDGYMSTTGDAIAVDGAADAAVTQYFSEVYKVNNLTIGSETMDFNDRFAFNPVGKDWLMYWRFRPTNSTYQKGLVNQWNSGKTANSTANISILGLYNGDKVTIKYAVKSDAAKLFFVKSGVATLDGVAVASGAAMESGKTYTIVAADDNTTVNLDLYITNNNIGIHTVTIVSDKVAETVDAPKCAITGVNNGERTITITPATVGTAGTAVGTTYYTIDGSEPSSTNGVVYTDPFVISESATIKSISYLVNGVASEVTTFEAEAGVTIPLSNEIISVIGFEENEGVYNPIVGYTYNKSSVFLSPEATLTAEFNGEVVELPYTIKEDGAITATATAEGYASQTEEISIAGEYACTRSIDFAAMSQDFFMENYGESWAAITEGVRLANWSKSYTYYGTTLGGGFIFDDLLSCSGSSSYPLSMIFGSGVGRSTGSTYTIANGAEGDIAVYEVNKSLAPTDNLVQHAISYMDDMKMAYAAGASQTIAKVSVYSPVRELTVTEGADLAVTGTYTSATYTRAIEAGKYGTICLPFAPDAASLENYTFFTMESAEGNTINFVEEEAPVANTPYIYCLKGDNEAITGGVTVVSADITDVTVGDWTMVGSFTNQSIDATTGNYYGYVAAENKIVKANTTLDVLPYRAYFTSTIGASAVIMRITRGDEATEISAAELDVQPVIYDLAGRRVEKMEKGIYIVNGKKVIR